MTHIGPKMEKVVVLVRGNPGCSKLWIADQVGPHGSTYYGYRTVNRAIRRGLIHARRLPSGRYELYASPDIGSERYITGEIIGLAFSALKGHQ
jgi:hypothetical protein